jgi:hypothetical protein
MGCGRVEMGGDRSLDSRRFSSFIVLIRVGVVNPPAATSLGRQAQRLPHQPGWGVPEGILMNVAHLWTGCGKIGSLFLQPSEVKFRPHSKALWRKSNREHAFDAIRFQKRGLGTQFPDWVRDNGNGTIRIIKAGMVERCQTQTLLR